MAGWTFAAQASEVATQLRQLLPDNVRPERAVVTGCVALSAHLGRHVQHDGDGKAVVLARQLDERLARLGLNVGGVDDRETAERQPESRNVL